MGQDDIFAREELKALGFVIDLLGSASSCIGTHDKVAREMILEVVSVLEKITGRDTLEMSFVTSPVSTSIH